LGVIKNGKDWTWDNGESININQLYLLIMIYDSWCQLLQTLTSTQVLKESINEEKHEKNLQVLFSSFKMVINT